MRELNGGYAQRSLALMHETGLLDHLMPELSARLRGMGDGERQHFTQTIERIDARNNSPQPVPPAVLFLALSIDYFSEERIREAGRVKRIIDDLFRAIGVTRREREEMEEIIPLAHAMFRAYSADDRHAEKLQQRHFVQEALLLIELTANNEDGYACIEFWRRRLSRRSRDRRHHQGRGRGRGNRR